MPGRQSRNCLHRLTFHTQVNKNGTHAVIKFYIACDTIWQTGLRLHCLFSLCQSQIIRPTYGFTVINWNIRYDTPSGSLGSIFPYCLWLSPCSAIYGRDLTKSSLWGSQLSRWWVNADFIQITPWGRGPTLGISETSREEGVWWAHLPSLSTSCVWKKAVAWKSRSHGSFLLWDAFLYLTMQYNTVQYNTIQHKTIRKHDWEIQSFILLKYFYFLKIYF